MIDEGSVLFEAGDLAVMRYDDGDVLIRNERGTVILDDHQAFQAATLIFGTDSDREPYCCAGER